VWCARHDSIGAAARQGVAKVDLGIAPHDDKCHHMSAAPTAASPMLGDPLIQSLFTRARARLPWRPAVTSLFADDRDPVWRAVVLDSSSASAAAIRERSTPREHLPDRARAVVWNLTHLFTKTRYRS
jgi:hypothetical protein